MATPKSLKDDFLTCHICMEVFQQPCTLQCQHTYCKECLSMYIKTQADAIKAQSIPCPSCRGQTPVPKPAKPVEEWAGQLKPSWVIQGLMDKVCQHVAEIEYCLLCKEEGETTPATSWCSECEVSLCEGCLKVHRRIPSSRHHDVTNLSDEVKPTKRRKFTCQEHKGKEVELFCKDCKKPLCTICCSISHRACKTVVTIQDMMHEFKQELGSHRDQLEMKIKGKKDAISKRKEGLDRLGRMTDKAKSDIDSIIDKTIDLLQKKRKQLTDVVDGINKEQSQRLTAEIKSEEMTLQVYQQESEFISQTVESECEADMHSMYQSYEPGSGESVEHTEYDDRQELVQVKFSHDMDKMIEAVDKIEVTAVTRDRPDLTKKLILHATHKTGMKAVYAVTEKSLHLTKTPTVHTTLETKIGDDEVTPGLRDIIVVTVKGTATVVVTDWKNKRTKSFYEKKNKPHSSKLQFEEYPWCFAKLMINQNQVVVSVPYARQIVTVEINPDLKLLSTITTSKGYWGLAVLSATQLAACTESPPGVDIMDMSGKVLRTFTSLGSVQKPLQDPRYLHVTDKGNILVSDWGSKYLISLTPDGNVVFSYCPQRGVPRGSTSTITGDILVAEGDKVIQLSQSGKFIRDLITSKVCLQNPCGLCINDNCLYVVMSNGDVTAYAFTD